MISSGYRYINSFSLREWCQQGDDWEDVANLCEPETKPDQHIPASSDTASGADGFVYLMKSGKHYKIGFTNSVDRPREGLINSCFQMY